MAAMPGAVPSASSPPAAVSGALPFGSPTGINRTDSSLSMVGSRVFSPVDKAGRQRLVINSSQGTPKNLIVLDKDEAAALLGRRDSSGSFDDPEEPPPPPVVEEVEEDEGVAVEVKAVAVEPEPVVEESEAESEASNESIHPSAERLLECARSGDDEMVGKLLVAGTEWDCETRVSKLKPLHWAVIMGHAKCVAVLLKNRNAKVDIKDRDGNTALHFAATHGRVAIVSQLLRGRAKLENANRWGVTALMMASYWNNKETVTVLLEAGADAGSRALDGDWKGKNSSDLAVDASARWHIFWKKRRDFQSEDSSAKEKVERYVPPDDGNATQGEESEPEEMDDLPKPEDEEAEAAAKAGAGAAKGAAKGRPGVKPKGRSVSPSKAKK